MAEYKQKEMNEMLDRVESCISKVAETNQENDMLAWENKNMAKFLLKDGYTNDDVDNIAKGFPIDKGGV